MSRSYKKTPVIKDNGQSKKKNKQLANRKVRRKLKDINYECSQNGGYQKIVNSWDIADYVKYWSKDEAIQQWKENQYDLQKRYSTLESWLLYWEKIVKRK